MVEPWRSTFLYWLPQARCPFPDCGSTERVKVRTNELRRWPGRAIVCVQEMQPARSHRHRPQLVSRFGNVGFAKSFM